MPTTPARGAVDTQRTRDLKPAPEDDTVSIASSRRSSASSIKSVQSLRSSASSSSSVSKRTTSSSISRSSLSTVASIHELEARKLDIEAQLQEVEAALKLKASNTKGVYKSNRPFALLPRSASGSLRSTHR
ncbi:hypothetical protein SPRG_10006 [Saprolegnia parasitica CBS 223.65]|uniref:Uncharacterized protein n=1 Tax=Saprolegnia parasitica (strain CBS 223.65) TaxID=695850 RepID=A0A067BY81_SAPPC|nr:hypothetical protein SPRG_10006 [Saprolegnia parasitica CBS 223.65]KDO23198.1 hypothetical protein SPRG_10006 [Saprolegnia parasitica CBS 223.65]|eukprot:XP_012206149.1 hypothetical protein SPRG_10006 [Saprolegnia parasitica CBS 223.65]